MELGHVSLDAAQEGSCMTGRSQSASLVDLSGTWELMNSVFIAFVLAPVSPSSSLNYCLSFPTLLSHSLPPIPHDAARAIFLNVYRTTPVSRFKPFTVFLSPLSDKAQVLTWTHGKLCFSNMAQFSSEPKRNHNINSKSVFFKLQGLPR